MSDPSTFRYHGVELEYFYHLYNLTHLNERMVELAVACDFVSKQSSKECGLEVGNVTGHYWRMTHAVWDLNEQRAWYQEHQPYANVDILDPGPVMFAYPWVMSLSTIEHTASPIDAIKSLKSLVAPGGQLLVSFPTGVNSALDEMVESGLPDFGRACTLVRDFDPRYWVQTPRPVVRDHGPWANSVVICEWTND